VSIFFFRWHRENAKIPLLIMMLMETAKVL
jgi:hypothetical protein